MGSRLMLSNAQKSAGTHTPISASDIAGLRNKFVVRRHAAMQRLPSVTNGMSLEIQFPLVSLDSSSPATSDLALCWHTPRAIANLSQHAAGATPQ